jgi:predicted ATPase
MPVDTSGSASTAAPTCTPAHSPILLASPGAQVLELGAHGIEPRAYDDLEAVRLTRDFLAAPERYLRAALAELDAD